MTNDDSVDSPALPPLLTRLRRLASVRAVLPAREYSWSSKTLSRFARLRLESAPQLGEGVYTVEGSPADCANLGVFHLEERPPSLVVSGPNIGENTGLSFLLSSGTVGGAIEASLAGVPAAAFSVRLSSEMYQGWRDTRNPAPLAEVWDRAAQVTADIVAELLRGGLPTDARLVSVNMPQEVEPDTPRILTAVNDTSYGSFFRRDTDGCLVHTYNGNQHCLPVTNGDVETVEQGAVSITPLRFQLAAEPTAQDRDRFEQSAP